MKLTLPKDLKTLLELDYYKSETFKELDAVGVEINTKNSVKLANKIDTAVDERIIEVLKENGYKGDFCSDSLMDLQDKSESAEEYILKVEEELGKWIDA